MPSQSEKKWPLIIVANRLPVERVKSKEGSKWKRSPGGLVSALTPIVQQAKGSWIGWSGVTGSAPKPFTHDGIDLLPISISREQLQAFYYGFCNGTIWPLYHGAIRQPEYHRHWWRPYVNVNRRYADITADAAGKNAKIWIHDYHLQLAPDMLRERRPDLRIGYFLHIPFPPKELFGRLPWRRQILEGLMGADVVGFQTDVGAENFIELAVQYTEARVRGGVLHKDGRSIRVKAFPISIDFDRYSTMASTPGVVKRSGELSEQVGQGRRIILGVDRLDYTKGIDVRLRGFQELLSRRRSIVRECVMVQLAVPSRERIAEYRELRSNVEELVGQINGEFGEVGMTPVQYLHRGLPFKELIALYRAADVMLVTPLADGMNLVAKEYVATRFDDTGVLILSEFTGAARELDRSLLVNPHDLNGLAETIDMAMSLPEREAKRRMRKMRETVAAYTVFDWAESFMQSLSEEE